MFSELELKVTAAFFPQPLGKTIKELQESSGYSYERVNTILKSLEQNGVVKSKPVGKVFTYALQTATENALLGYIHYAMNRKSKFRDNSNRVGEAIENLAEKVRCHSVIVFGSYAKGNATARSDVDVLFVSEDKNIDKVALSLRHKYGVRINAVTVPMDKFRNMEHDNPEFYKDLVEFGVVIKGFEVFFELVYR